MYLELELKHCMAFHLAGLERRSTCVQCGLRFASMSHDSHSKMMTAIEYGNLHSEAAFRNRA